MDDRAEYEILLRRQFVAIAQELAELEGPAADGSGAETPRRHRWHPEPPEDTTGPPAPQTRIVLRPLASSTPLGFYAFGVGSALYTALELHWVPLTQTMPLAVLLLAFAAPLQVIAGLIGFATRDVGLGTAMLTFGAVWVCLSVVLLNAAPGSRSPVLGIFLIAISVVILTIGVAAVAGKPLLSVLALFAVARYATTAAYQFLGTPALERASGWLGVPIMVLAAYGGLAFLLEDAAGRTVLPVGRRKRALVALEGDLADQVAGVAREAGVRHQL